MKWPWDKHMEAAPHTAAAPEVAPSTPPPAAPKTGVKKAAVAATPAAAALPWTFYAISAAHVVLSLAAFLLQWSQPSLASQLKALSAAIT